jgi:hypothetical protein
MVEADPKMRAARNGFLVLIVALLGTTIYRFAVVESADAVVASLWLLGAGVFYASKRYYARKEPDESSEESEGSSEEQA